MKTIEDMFEQVTYVGEVADWRDLPDEDDSCDLQKSFTSLSLLKLKTDDQADEAAPHSASQAQIEAGNYKKGHIDIGPLHISIENPAGTQRRPEWPPLKHHYGYIRGTIGNDGGHIDCFVRTGISKDYRNTVFIVNQANEDGTFDEHKCMIGWDGEHDATAAYLENYTEGWDRIISVTKMPFTDFCNWVRNGDHQSIAIVNDGVC